MIGIGAGINLLEEVGCNHPGSGWNVCGRRTARIPSNRRCLDSAPLLWNVDGLLPHFEEFLIALAYQVKNEVNLRLTRETLERLSLLRRAGVVLCHVGRGGSLF